MHIFRVAVWCAASLGLAAASSFDPALFKALEWRNIGPNRGGRSIASAGSSSRPFEYYFGAVGGGLWKTTDGGVTWKPATDGQLHSSSVGAVAVSESNPDVVYIGMGETEFRGNVMQGDGIYKSTDAGKTWKNAGLGNTQAIARVRVDPTNPDIVYVAALGHPYGSHEERGVFRSKDGGKTWKKVLYRSNRSGAVDLCLDPNNPKVLFAAIWDAYRMPWSLSSGGPESGLFKSTDGGDSWKEITRNAGLPRGTIGKIGVTVSSDSDHIYAIVEAEDGGVFASDDGGSTWKRVSDDRKLRQRAFYYSRIYADPRARNTVYVLNTAFFKSTDGGKTYKAIRVPHGDNHDLWIAPDNPKRMIESNDGGANVSVNGGESWTGQAYPTAQLYHVATTRDIPYHVCGAQQDNTTICVSSAAPVRGYDRAGTVMYSAGGGESGYIAPDPMNPNIFYAGSQGALLTRFDRRSGYTKDVQVYPRFFSGEPAASLPERWQWTFPIVFSPLDPGTLYTSSQHLWRTTNEGHNWEAISPDLTRADPKTLGDSGGPITKDQNGPEIYGTIFTIAPSRKEKDTIWTGSDDGVAYITRNGGKNWAKITPPDLPEFSRISLIEASPHDAGTAYLAAKRYQLDDRRPYLYRTRDYGKTWTKIVNGIPDDDFAHAIREDPKKAGLLFAGTEHGIYVSFDDGGEWQSLSLNLPDTQVPDLVIEGDDLVIATHGRSFYVLHDISPLRQITPELTTSNLHVFHPSMAFRNVSQADIDYFLKTDSDKVTVDILDSRGQVVRTFTGTPDDDKKKKNGEGDADEEFGPPRPKPVPRKAGFNRYTWDLRYPGAKTFHGLIFWGARAETGPLAVPGAYQVRVTANGATVTQPLTVEKDPRLDSVTVADLSEQFKLAMQVRDKVTAADEIVILIRELKKQMEQRLKESQDASLKQSLDAFRDKLSGIEESVYQVRNRSNQDPLNFPIKLNNRLGALERSIETGDGKPTAGSYKVFEELSKELAAEQHRLDEVLKTGLPPVNRLLAEHKMRELTPTTTETKSDEATGEGGQ